VLEPERPSKFYKYVNPDVGKLILRSRRMRWSSPKLFNDDYDCFYSIAPKFDMDAVLKKVMKLMAEKITQEEDPVFHPNAPSASFLRFFRLGFKGRSAQDVEKILSGEGDTKEYLKNFRALCDEVEEQWKNERNDLRILCVCEDYRNQLLWTKYADHHQGIALELEAKRELDSALLAAVEVEYTEDPPALATEEEWIAACIGLAPLPTGSEVWRRQVFTKSKDWEHENEWRVITKKRSDETLAYANCEFLPSELTAVYFGCNISDQDKAEMCSLLQGDLSHVRLFQAKQNPQKPELEFSPLR